MKYVIVRHNGSVTLSMIKMYVFDSIKQNCRFFIFHKYDKGKKIIIDNMKSAKPASSRHHAVYRVKELTPEVKNFLETYKPVFDDSRPWIRASKVPNLDERQKDNELISMSYTIEGFPIKVGI